MLRSDRVLAAIVVGLVALVVVAFVVVLRQPPAEYLGADTPEGTANDYVLALARGEYARAYDLLGDGLPARPDTLEDFIRDVDDRPWSFGTDEASEAIRVLSTELTAGQDGRELASVRLERTVFTDLGLLDTSQYSRTSVLRLRRSHDGRWLVVGGDDYVHPCWVDAPDCYRQLRPPEAREAYP